MNSESPPQFAPLGDQGILVSLPDESSSLQFAQSVGHCGFSWIVDIVQAYKSVAVFHNHRHLTFTEAVHRLANLPIHQNYSERVNDCKSHVIPCCYEMHYDLSRVATHTGLSTDEVICGHSETEYLVCAIGFCPGFPYLGYLSNALCGVPRLSSPRTHVEEGSVALTGRQTGVYTLPRPGGWNLIGKTPLQLVNVEDEYFPIRTGDRVRFHRIDETEFSQLKGERLL